MSPFAFVVAHCPERLGGGTEVASERHVQNEPSRHFKKDIASVDLDAQTRQTPATQRERIILRPNKVERMGFFEAIRVNLRQRFSRR